MNTNPGMVCFQHCQSRIFCFELPTSCPHCNVDLEEAEFKLLPFSVPYPFVRAEQHPCAVFIKPTTGDFLNDYSNHTDLHIGVTDSKGYLVEYDRFGLRKHQPKNSWLQCLILDQVDEDAFDHWDKVLQQVIRCKNWSSLNYDETSFNCYSFVLAFLRRLNMGRLSKAAECKTLFCEEFIVPRTTAAGKYISIYRKVCCSENGLWYPK